VIEPGENLYRISLLYDMDWHLLAAANQISNPAVIYAGQSLVIPAIEGAAPPALPTTHVVQPGENLYRIGRQYSLSWDVIARANGIINPNRILVGQVLTIPAGVVPLPALPATHTVGRGENLYRIGLYYGVPWPTIAVVNGIVNPDRIQVGMELTIPVVER
jgi:LysM repeat protein